MLQKLNSEILRNPDLFELSGRKNVQGIMYCYNDHDFISFYSFIVFTEGLFSGYQLSRYFTVQS